MRIKSRAGDFQMSVDEIAVENGELVLTGKMGVWQAKTYVSPADLQQLLREVKVRGNVFDFLALFAFRYLRELLSRGQGGADPLPGAEA